MKAAKLTYSEAQAPQNASVKKAAVVARRGKRTPQLDALFAGIAKSERFSKAAVLEAFGNIQGK